MSTHYFREARDYLIGLDLDFINNYLTVEKFAEHNGLLVDEAGQLLALAREVASHEHPEA